MTRIVGPAGSRRRRRFLVGPLFLVTLVALFWITGAQAVHDTGNFELDGNAVNGAAVGDDWDNVCHQVTITDDTCSTIPNECASAVEHDRRERGLVGEPARTTPPSSPAAARRTRRHQPVGLEGRGRRPARQGQPPAQLRGPLLADRPSADVPGAGTAATCDVLYFGSDRFDNSGDAQQGFWFFQNKITLGTTAVRRRAQLQRRAQDRRPADHQRLQQRRHDLDDHRLQVEHRPSAATSQLLRDLERRGLH